MKIVCDSCSTKYSISDDKVRGKVFKIRCKKCSHIIVVKGNTEAAPAAPEAPSDAVWHLVVDGDQVGPLTDAEVRARLSRNEITAENYVWKEGFADWLRLADVPEFADVAISAVPSTSIGGELFSDSGQAPSADAPTTSDFFGTGQAEHDVGRVSGQSGRMRFPAANDEDAFAASAANATPAADSADLFGAAPMVARGESGRVRGRATNGTGGVSGRHDGGRVENLTAQRSENSVLFSLSNLQSLASPAPAQKPSTSTTTEGSGLIDIRAMAASTLRAPAGGGSPLFGGGDSRSAEDDLPAFGAFSSAAPVLLSIPSQSGPPKWIYALVVLIALLIIAAGAATFSILGRPVIVEAPPPPPVVAAPAPSAPKPAAETAAPSKALAEGELPPREGGEPTGDKGGDKGPAKVGVGKKFGKTFGKRVGGGDKGAAAGGADKAGGPVVPAEPEKPKAAKGSLDDLLEGALNNNRGGKTTARPKVEDDSSPKKGEAAGGGPLQKSAVVAGMNGIKGKISACYQQYKQAGMAMVNVVIGKSGKVSSATVTGKFAGTPTGTCVESAVKSASFPPSDGLTTPYPFTLR